MKTAKHLLPAAVALTCASLAQAQNTVLEEIVVTAEKRSASVQDVAIAISAFDADMRDNIGIISAADIANHTPSMTFQTNPNRVFIRGVGRVDNALGTDPGVVTYRDGIYTAELGGVAQSTFFTDRVEVLRGPQGTLYGRNAVGGAVNFIAKRPTEEFKAELRAGAYSNEGYQLGAAVSGPATESIRYRFAAEMDQNDGWVDNRGGDDVNDKDFWRAEAQFDIDITERLNLWVQYEHAKDDSNRIGAYMISPYNTASPGPLVMDFFTDFQQLVPNPQYQHDRENPGARDIHKVDWDAPGFIDREEDRFTAHLSYEFDKMTLKYIYGYVDYDFAWGEDLDKTSRSDVQHFSYLEQNEQTQQHELQLISNLGGDLEFILGAFYWDSENYQPLQAFVPDNPVLQNPVTADPAGDVCYCVLDAPPNPDAIYYEQWGDLDTESTAVYGQLDYTLNEQWSFSFGLRYSEDEKEGEEFNRAIFDDQGVYAPFFSLIGMLWLNEDGPQDRIAWDLTDGGNSASREDDWSSTDWSVGVDYTLDNGNLVYGKVATAYKSGGFRLGNVEDSPSVDEEQATVYEIGMKNEWERARLNVAAYYYDYEDMQVPVDTFQNGVTTRQFVNAEEAWTWGVELEGTWAATDALNLSTTYSYLETEIDDMGQMIIDSTEALPLPQDVSGNSLVQSPEHQFSFVADYSWQLPTGDLILAGVYSYKDDQYSSIFNRASTQVDSYDRTDFRLTYRDNRHDLRVTAYVQNAFDEEIIETITRSSAYYNNQLSASIQPPRIYGVEVNYGF